MADEDRSFDTDPAQVNHGREQGLGMGQRDLAAQRDPDQLPQTPLELGDDDDLKSEPGDEDAVLHANHALRGEKTSGESQGVKTRTATKDQISRR
jgi:hypothetical protein